MRGDVFRDASTFGGFLNGFPDDLRRNRFIGSPTVFSSRKQVGLRSHPAPVCTQGFQQLLVQGNLAVDAAFAPLDPEDHPLAINVADLLAPVSKSSIFAGFVVS